MQSQDENLYSVFTIDIDLEGKQRPTMYSSERFYRSASILPGNRINLQSKDEYALVILIHAKPVIFYTAAFGAGIADTLIV